MYKKIKNEIREFFCKQNYKNVIKRIKKYPKDKKIRVLFYVTENSKWGYQFLYELFDKNPIFEPIICVGILDIVHNGRDKTRFNLEENYNFFKERNMNVFYAYKDNAYIDLKEFTPDIVFYEQPWGLPRLYNPKFVSKFALTCYCPYSYNVVDSKDHYKSNFHVFLWKMFVETESHKSYLEKYSKKSENNCIVTGYPKLDIYLNQKNADFGWKDSNKFKIIYAPHHTFIESSLKLGTFQRNGKLILEWAKAHPETTWVFKAHPRFRLGLMEANIMNEKEIEEYYKMWSEVGVVYDSGNYFDIFKSSDLMITDCGSFLAEYLPTGKPLIRLMNKDSIKLSPIAEEITTAYYKSFDNNDLQEILKTVVEEKNDYMKEKRLLIKEKFFGFEEPASVNICSHLLLEFGKEN